MNAKHDLERRLADFYSAEAPLQAPDRVLSSALLSIDNTTQRRAHLRVPWRTPSMSNFAKLAVAAVAAIAVGALGLAILFGGRGPRVGTDPSPSPSSSQTPSSSAAAGVQSPPASTRPSLSETFTSDIHGISVSYPAGWTVVPATLPWGSEFPTMSSGTADIIYERDADSPFIALASQPLAGVADESWVADFAATYTENCPAPTEPVTIDGRGGVIVDVCAGDPGRPLLAVVSVPLALRADRGYLIYLYRMDDVEWFKEILSTVRLEPANAVDPVDGSGFRHPFEVWMPPGEGWEAVPIENEAYAEFRIPGSGAGGEESAVGVILRAIDGGRQDPCAEVSKPMALQGGPETVIDISI